jgi:hypothetical protein
MDPVSLVVAALAAGAAAGLKDMAGEAVRDSFTALKVLVRRRVQGDPAAEAGLGQLTRDPGADTTAFRQRLVHGAWRQQQPMEPYTLNSVGTTPAPTRGSRTRSQPRPDGTSPPGDAGATTFPAQPTAGARRAEDSLS